MASAVSYLPNAITLARLGAVPVILWAILEARNGLAFALFVAAGISDAIDGFLAKRLGVTSRLGAMLDPLADKALLMGTYVTLGLQDRLEPWLVVIVVGRDLLILSAVGLSVLGKTRFAIAPLLISKINTAGQIALVALVLGSPVFGLAPTWPVATASVIVSATTVLSAFAYLRVWLRGSAP